MPKFWITKHALVGGIATADGSDPSPLGYTSAKIPGAVWPQTYKVGRDAFLTETEAIAYAGYMRLRKIDALKKQIAKLEELRF